MRTASTCSTASTSTEVTVENGRIRGVRVGDREIGAETVLSNASIKATAEKLVAPEHFDSTTGSLGCATSA